MKLHATNPLLNDWTGDAEITTEHSASSYGRLVLVIDGEPVGALDAMLAGYEILEATHEECEALILGGYTLSAPPDGSY